MLNKFYSKFKICVVFSLFIISCESEGVTTPEITQVLEISFDTDENSSLMFYDDELEEEMTSEWRRYQIGNVLRVKPIDSLTIEIANFAPVDIENATILAKIEGIESEIQLFTISKTNFIYNHFITFYIFTYEDVFL